MAITKFSIHSVFVFVLLLSFGSIASAQTITHLIANFDGHPVGPIGTGGAALGEPVDIIGCVPTVTIDGRFDA